MALSATNQSTGEVKKLSGLKADLNGQITTTWDASFLGAGIWELQANGRQLSSSTTVIYVGTN